MSVHPLLEGCCNVRGYHKVIPNLICMTRNTIILYDNYVHNFGNENIFHGTFLHRIENFVQERRSGGLKADFFLLVSLAS